MLTAYLSFNGNTEEAFRFYQSVLGGAFQSLQRYSDTPHGDNMPAGEKEKVMHVALQTPHGTLMGNDHMSFMGDFNAGNNFSLSVHPDSKAEADRIFNGLSAGGTVIMPLEKAFWGAYFGMLLDRFGIKWMVNYEEKAA